MSSTVGEQPPETDRGLRPTTRLPRGDQNVHDAIITRGADSWREIGAVRANRRSWDLDASEVVCALPSSAH